MSCRIPFFVKGPGFKRATLSPKQGYTIKYAHWPTAQIAWQCEILKLNWDIFEVHHPVIWKIRVIHNYNVQSSDLITTRYI